LQDNTLKKKISIIGAGVAGLSAGCYLQASGFDTVIYESHEVSGGLCACWYRQGFTINGSAHWVMGSGPGSSFYKIWSELLDIDAIPFVNHELKIDIVLPVNRDKYGSNTFHVYNDLETFRNYLLDIAPEDEKRINRFIRKMRLLQQFEMPPVSLATNFSGKVCEIIDKISYLKVLPLVISWARQTNISYAARFKNAFLREGFSLLFDEEEVKMLVFAVPLAAMDKKSAGYPLGGSYPFIRRIEDKFISLGGRIEFGARVQKIITENGQARGMVLENGQCIYSDGVLSSADWYNTFYEVLEGSYSGKKQHGLLNQNNFSVFYSAVIVTFGVRGNFSKLPHYSRFPLNRDIESPDGTKYNRMEVHIYNYDQTLSPEGCTNIEVSFYTTQGDFWIDKRNLDRELYKQMKIDFSERILKVLEDKYGNIRNNLLMTDVATPATFYRYTNNWKGSTQGWMPGKNFLDSRAVKYKIKGLDRMWYAGHWCVAGGGMPMALKSARDVSIMICRSFGQKFRAAR
jgi:phytoene dehydrogenase-like protein